MPSVVGWAKVASVHLWDCDPLQVIGTIANGTTVVGQELLRRVLILDIVNPRFLFLCFFSRETSWWLSFSTAKSLCSFQFNKGWLLFSTRQFAIMDFFHIIMGLYWYYYFRLVYIIFWFTRWCKISFKSLQCMFHDLDPYFYEQIILNHDHPTWYFVHTPENLPPENRPGLKRNIFQLSIFRCQHVSFREGIFWNPRWMLPPTRCFWFP